MTRAIDSRGRFLSLCLPPRGGCYMAWRAGRWRTHAPRDHPATFERYLCQHLACGRSFARPSSSAPPWCRWRPLLLRRRSSLVARLVFAAGKSRSDPWWSFHHQISHHPSSHPPRLSRPHARKRSGKPGDGQSRKLERSGRRRSGRNSFGTLSVQWGTRFSAGTPRRAPH